MTDIHENYINKLDELKNGFFIALSNFEEAYANYKILPIDDNKEHYLKTQQDLDIIYSQLFILENQIIKSSDNMNDSLAFDNQTINDTSKSLKNITNKYNNIKQTGDASLPRYKEYIYNYRVLQVKLGLTICTTVLFGYIFFKHMKKKE
jgi:hypothetical protein